MCQSIMQNSANNCLQKVGPTLTLTTAHREMLRWLTTQCCCVLQKPNINARTHLAYIIETTRERSSVNSTHHANALKGI